MFKPTPKKDKRQNDEKAAKAKKKRKKKNDTKQIEETSDERSEINPETVPEINSEKKKPKFNFGEVARNITNISRLSPSRKRRKEKASPNEGIGSLSPDDTTDTETAMPPSTDERTTEPSDEDNQLLSKAPNTPDSVVAHQSPASSQLSSEPEESYDHEYSRPIYLDRNPSDMARRTTQSDEDRKSSSDPFSDSKNKAPLNNKMDKQKPSTTEENDDEEMFSQFKYTNKLDGKDIKSSHRSSEGDPFVKKKTPTNSEDRAPSEKVDKAADTTVQYGNKTENYKPNVKPRSKNVEKLLDRAEGCGEDHLKTSPRFEANVFEVDKHGRPKQNPIGPRVFTTDEIILGSVINQFSRLPLETIHHYAMNGELLHSFCKDRKLIDVLVHINKRIFYAHRLILCTHSKVFQNILLNNDIPPYTVTDVTLECVNDDLFKRFLCYAYTGYLDISEEDYEEWQQLAHQLKSDTLKAHLVLLVSKMEPLPLDKAVKIGITGCDSIRKPRALRTIRERFQEILDCSDAFYQFDVADLIEMLKSSDLCVNSEIEVFWAVLFWVAYDPVKRTQHLDQLMSCVRFTCMSSLELLDCARVTDLIKMSNACIQKLVLANWVCHSRETGLQDPLSLPQDKQRNCLQSKNRYQPTVAEFDLRYLRYQKLLNQSNAPANWRRDFERNHLPESDRLGFADEMGGSLEDVILFNSPKSQDASVIPTPILRKGLTEKETDQPYFNRIDNFEEDAKQDGQEKDDPSLDNFVLDNSDENQLKSDQNTTQQTPSSKDMQEIKDDSEGDSNVYTSTDDSGQENNGRKALSQDYANDKDESNDPIQRKISFADDFGKSLERVKQISPSSSQKEINQDNQPQKQSFGKDPNKEGTSQDHSDFPSDDLPVDNKSNWTSKSSKSSTPDASKLSTESDIDSAFNPVQTKRSSTDNLRNSLESAEPINDSTTPSSSQKDSNQDNQLQKQSFSEDPNKEGTSEEHSDSHSVDVPVDNELNRTSKSSMSLMSDVSQPSTVSDTDPADSLQSSNTQQNNNSFTKSPKASTEGVVNGHQSHSNTTVKHKQKSEMKQTNEINLSLNCCVRNETLIFFSSVSETNLQTSINEKDVGSSGTGLGCGQQSNQCNSSNNSDALAMWQSSVLESEKHLILTGDILLPIKTYKTSLTRVKSDL